MGGEEVGGEETGGEEVGGEEVSGEEVSGEEVGGGEVGGEEVGGEEVGGEEVGGEEVVLRTCTVHGNSIIFYYTVSNRDFRLDYEISNCYCQLGGKSVWIEEC